MKFQLGAMSVGDILDRGLKLLFSRLGTFYAINLIVQSPLIAFQILAPTALSLDLVVALLITLFLAIVLTFIGTAAELKVIEQTHIDRKVGTFEAIGFAMSRFWPLLAVSIIYGLVIFVGLLLLIVPGLIFLCMFAFASQAVVLEGAGPIEGMDRSSKLTSGYKWRIFGIYVLVIALSLGANIILELAFNALAPPAANQTNLIIYVLVGALVGILLNTYGTVCLTLAYFDLRTRKEGFDLELAAQGLPQRERDDYVDDDDRRRGRRDDDDDDDYYDRPRRRDDDDDYEDRRRRDDD